MSITLLDKIGELITGLGLEPVTTVLGLAFLASIAPALKRGVLDNRLEDIVESLDYGLVVLSLGFLLAFYYQYGIEGVQSEILSITGGFILGTLVVRTITRLTEIK